MEGTRIQASQLPEDHSDIKNFFEDFDRRTSMAVNSELDNIEVDAKTLEKVTAACGRLAGFEYVQDTSSTIHFQARNGGKTLVNIAQLKWMRSEVHRVNEKQDER